MTTDILVILDRSGSMQSRRTDHEGGLKSFVESQAALPGDVRFTLVQFDSVAPCEIVYDRVPIAEATDIRLVPRGDTPLLDAMGKALAHLEAHKPESVICMVITDGEENSSREWTKAQVAARVRELSADHRWQFLFLAANVDAFSEARGLGVMPMRAMAFNAHQAGATRSMYASASANVAEYRIETDTMGGNFADASATLDWAENQRDAAAETTVATQMPEDPAQKEKKED